MVSYGFLSNGMYPPVWSTRTRHGADNELNKNHRSAGGFSREADRYLELTINYD